MSKVGSGLPVEDYKEDILRSIKENPVTIITAETGAGKSTLIPQWLWLSGKKVLVTQPRRIAARSLSHYLSGINGMEWGKEIGYQTGFDRKKTKVTKLLYLTDGVQLVNEIKGHLNYDILIIDEVHEWNLNQEVLVGMVKKRLVKNYYKKKGKRVVIMSATLEAERLSDYLGHAPVISVPGRGFPVSMHYNSTHFLLSDTIAMIENNKNCLVFLPGKREISDFSDMLKETLKHDKTDAVVLPLHSELNIKQQSKVFNHYDVPKVVVSTDIAQTSLTIDDIDAVIDSGTKKEIRTIKGIEGLYQVEISRSESLQRAGRAGRVKNGQYILCSDFPNLERDRFPEPEIRRLNLESVILRFIKWGIDPAEFPFFHSPRKNLIKKAMEKLVIFGAVDRAGNITEEGKAMADLPVSVRGARLLLEIMRGGKGNVDSALKIIALIETKGIAGKEYVGEKIYSGFYSSDLLNQLYLWNSSARNRKMISMKKLELAKEIYGELKRRIPPELLKRTKGKKEDVRSLFRAILSSFSDHIYVRSGKSYFMNDEERQLDRNSVLYELLPDMVVALPFDLTIERENRFSGEKERAVLPLLTFSTEVSLKILEEFKPFGYEKKEETEIEKGVVFVKNYYFFGGRLIADKMVEPPIEDKSFRKRLAPLVLRWWREFGKKYELSKSFEKITEFFPDVERITDMKLREPVHYLDKFIETKIVNELNTKDLNLFFTFHKGFHSLRLSNILPANIISVLKKKKWPGKIMVSGEEIPINYFKGKPYIEAKSKMFERLGADDLLLQTGTRAGVLMDGRRFSDWDYAVYNFNRNKKLEIFRKRWKMSEKAVEPDDLVNVNFPVQFVGGTGMKKEKFIFYSVPGFKDGKVFLKHFFEKAAAEKYFETVKEELTIFLREHKDKKIKDIFHKKGWKVK